MLLKPVGGQIKFDGKSLKEMIPGGFDAASKYRIECKYANGVTMHYTSDGGPNKHGITFEGTEGWVYVHRGGIDADGEEGHIERANVVPTLTE